MYFVIALIVVIVSCVAFSTSMFYYDELDNRFNIRKWPIYRYFYTKRFESTYKLEQSLSLQYREICGIIDRLNTIARDVTTVRGKIDIKPYSNRVAELSAKLHHSLEEGDRIVRELYIHVRDSRVLEKRFVHNGIVLSEYKRSINRGKSAVALARRNLERLAKRYGSTIYH